MKSLSLALTALLVVSVVSLQASPTAPAPSAANTYVREPVLVYASEQRSATETLSRSLIVYQDGFVVVSHTADGGAGTQAESKAGNVGAVKVRSWVRSLLQAGAATLPDGPTPDPAAGGVATLTVSEPGTSAWAHTFSYGAGDYPVLEGVVNAIFLRLGV